MTRVHRQEDCIATPAAIAPRTKLPFDHLLFALKHEGTNLSILAEALPQIPANQLEGALKNSPNGQYLRKAGFLWEHFTGRELRRFRAPQGGGVLLFDPKQYVTGPARRNSRWRLDFNGLGTIDYCASIERTVAIDAMLKHDVLERTRQFMKSLPEEMMDRAINWAYLHETQDSFAIEKEAPSGDKARRFIQLLHQAHDRVTLSEKYLVELQNSVVGNPFDQAALFRHEQNHLRSSMRGLAGVTYIPPPPELCRELMGELMAFANELPDEVPPLVMASVISFGFVFLHPFMDGNGRLSRFLIHHSLCSTGALDRGTLLPISVAMKKHERGYLEALRSFSAPVRDRWDMSWLDGERFGFEFEGEDAIYRYWDATECTEFLLRMADQALDVELRAETEFLANYDKVYRAMDDQFDVRGSDLSLLIVNCLDQGGRVSNNRRKQFKDRVPESVFDALEAIVRDTLSRLEEDPAADDQDITRP